ncbi:hypothetical protein NBRC116601_33300 [Cognatishimia sp. WU-CL00825]|uniref:lipopolysaccharide biosynthesis protein n=1 Tax=Cognatishimia sp. WU-CL00825 TaxID=3127658 RepID=UPI003106C4B1
MTSQSEKSADSYGSSSLKGILKKALSLVGGRVGGNLLTLGYTLLLARLATPAEFGLVMTGFAWTMLLSIGLALNVESGSIKYLVHYREADKLGLMAGFIRFNRSIILAMSVLAALSCLGLWALGLLDLAGQTAQVLILALLAAPIVALTRVYARHATALGQVLRGGLPIMLARPGVICLLLGLVWLSGVQVGPSLLMVLLLLAFVLTALLQAFLLRKTFADATEATPDFSARRSWLGTGAMMAPLLVLRDNLKHVIVASAGLVLGAAEVGYLALALSLMSLAYFSMKAVDIALSPQLSKALQNKNLTRVAHLVKTAAKLKLVALVLGCGLLALFGEPILAVFGPAYQVVFVPLFILMLVPAAEALFGPAQIVLNVTGRQAAVFWVAGISAAVLVGATVLGGWIGAVNGAAAGAGMSYLLQQALLWRVSLKNAHVDTSMASLWATKRPENS